jgi:hypothetical protein
MEGREYLSEFERRVSVLMNWRDPSLPVSLDLTYRMMSEDEKDPITAF